MHCTRPSAVVGIFFCGVLLSAFAHAQEAFTVPRSNRVIFGELTFPDEPPGKSKVRFVVRDGTWVTVEDRQQKFFFGFNGIINDQTKNPNFVAYELVRVTPEETNVIELDQSKAAQYTSPDVAAAARDIRIGKAVTFTSARNIRLKVTGVGEWAFAAPYITDVSQLNAAELEQDFGVSASGTCCVTCQSRTVCASSVSTSCGDCEGSGGGPLAN